MNSSNDSSVGTQTTIIRSFRIVRIFFFFKSSRSLKNTMTTFMLCFPAMLNIGMLLILINLIFSILGVYFFAEIMPNGELNDYTHFRTFTSSFITLIRIMTGEKWPLLMEALSQGPSPYYQCKYSPTYEDYYINKSKHSKFKLFRQSYWMWLWFECEDIFLYLLSCDGISLYEIVHSYRMADLLANW